MPGHFLTSAFVGALLLLSPAGAASQSATVESPNGPVLFICEHGTVKSLMAKLLFERYAAEAGLNVRAVSRGSAVEPAVPEWMRANLRGDGFALGSWTPQPLKPEDLHVARYVASFDLPASVSSAASVPRTQLDSLPATSRDYAANRDAIALRVHRLVDSLVAVSRTVDWSAIDVAIGRAGVVQAGEVHRYNFPRGDLTVTVASPKGDVRLRPSLALGGWIAMHAMKGGDTLMAMGDLVLTEREIEPVISALQAEGVLDVDTAGIARALGRTGRVNGGVYQISVPRSETIRDGEMPIPPAMGLGTAINFQPTGGGKAAITGDFVQLASEVNPVIRALRAAGIDVTSVHNHMLADEPRLFFMHFWANEDAVTLARGLRTALDLTNTARPSP